MDSATPDGKPAKSTKRAKKRASAESEKKTHNKSEEMREKSNSNATFPDGDNGQDVTEQGMTEGPIDGCSGDSNSHEILSMNSVLSLILDQKKKELLECPEVIQLIQHPPNET